MPAQCAVHPLKSISVMANTESQSSISPPVPLTSPTGDAGGTTLNGREARNLAEKQRRDKLNASINELAKMVPHVADCPRRLDKTAVLRFATHGLRLQYVFGKSAARRRSLQNGENHPMTDTLMHLIDSFFITLTCHGQIVLISSSVENLLGHCQSDLYGQNLLQITHPEDHEMLRQQLIPSDIESLFADMQNLPAAGQTQAKASQYSQQHSSYTPASSQQKDQGHNNHTQPYDSDLLRKIDERLQSDKRSFTVRLARASTRTESKKYYEIVKIDGCFRRSDSSAVSEGSSGYPIVSQLIRRSRNAANCQMVAGTAIGSGGNAAALMPHLMQHDVIAQAALHGVSGNDIVLVGMARIIRPARIINSPGEANRLEYKTRHLIDGRIIDCDHRIGLVAGYLQEEVRNLSPFSFMHQDDVRWVIVALRQMYDCNSDYGESCFRLLSRNGDFIYLQTKGFLEIDHSTNKVHSFVCINTLLDEEEGKRRVYEMKRKFSIIINAKVPTGTRQDATASQDPKQLEKIVLYLIENLQKRQPHICEVDELHTEEDALRHSSTPPLALVPPEPSDVKNSISKSVSVVISTAAKSLVMKNNSKASKLNKARDDLPASAQADKNNAPSSTTTLSPASATSSSPLSSPSTPSSSPGTSTSSPSTSTNTATSAPAANQLRPSVLKMHTKHKYPVHSNTSSTSKSHEFAQNCEAGAHVSVLKRLHVDTELKSVPLETVAEECHSPQPAKRISTIHSPPSSSQSSSCGSSSSAIQTDSRSDIHRFISNTLRNVGESLSIIDSQTTSLRQQQLLPQALDDQLDAIIMEQQKQSEFLVNIRNEYDAYSQQYENPSIRNRTQNPSCSSDNL